MEVDKIYRKYLVPILLGLILVVTIGYWGYGEYRDKQQLEVYMGNKYQQSFYQLLENIEQIQVLLGKALVSSSPNQNILTLNDIWRNADIAQAELNKLPLSEAALYDTAKYLNQTGDYAHVMARKNAEGAVFSTQNRRELEGLRKQSIQLSEALHDLDKKVTSDEMNWSEIVKGTKNKLEDRENVFDENFDDLQQDLTKYPTLIYDGPFSDHITEAKPKGKLGRKVTREQASKEALNVITQQIGTKPDITYVQTVEGKIPSYSFEITTREENTFLVDVSIEGGKVVNYIVNREIGNKKIDEKTAAEKGSQFLAMIDYPNMNPTYIEEKENIAYVSYAYNKDNVVYYPDLINLQIALDNGEIVAIEALSYLMTHRDRELPEPKISSKEARKLINNRLEVIDEASLALIPRAGGNEILTYEIKGKIGNEIYLVYIDVEDGQEKQILQLIQEDGGTFAI